MSLVAEQSTGTALSYLHATNQSAAFLLTDWRKMSERNTAGVNQLFVTNSILKNFSLSKKLYAQGDR